LFLTHDFFLGIGFIKLNTNAITGQNKTASVIARTEAPLLNTMTKFSAVKRATVSICGPLVTHADRNLLTNGLTFMIGFFSLITFLLIEKGEAHPKFFLSNKFKVYNFHKLFFHLLLRNDPSG